MFSFGIRNSAFPDYFYLMELTIQCELAKHAYTRLFEYAKVELSKEHAAIHFRPQEGIAVIADCTVFLSAAGAIAKCLFPHKDRKRNRKARASALRTMLDISDTDFPNVNSVSVRNSFEHIDDRLDDVIRNHPEKTICQVHVSRTKPTYPVVLRHFDPNTMMICFIDDRLNLAECAKEIAELEIRLSDAKNCREKIRRKTLDQASP